MVYMQDFIELQTQRDTLWTFYFLKWIMADKICNVCIKPMVSGTRAGLWEVIALIDIGIRTRSKGRYRKLNAHICSAASQVCPRHFA